MSQRRFFGIAVLITILLQPLMAVAQNSAEVNYELIIADAQLTSYTTMDQQDIQSFLESKQGYISNYFFTVDTGERVSASEWIYRTAQKHKVNPQFLLTLLQKEQSLVEEKTPKQTQLDWATGYGCFDGQPCNERWRGFFKQVNSAAEQFRYYYENISEYTYQPGKSSTIDGRIVTPRNIVTAALYNYTPHLHGNSLFFSLWNKYFVSFLPDATLVQVTGEPGVWLLQNGTKRAFKSWLALVSRYNPDLIVEVTESEIENYARGIDIEFAAYSLLRGNPSGNIYLLTVDEKRLITSMDVFRTLGFNPEEVEEVSDHQLRPIPDGKSITLGDAYPTGAVLQDSVSGDLYYVEAGRRYAIRSEDILSINYPTHQVAKVDSSVIRKYSSGLPIQLKEGTLVKGSGSDVFVISNHKKRHITSEKVFNTIGYKWSNIIAVSDVVLNLHQTGEPLVLNN